MGQDNGQQSSIMNSLPLAMATGLFAIQKFEIGQEPKEWLEIFESSVTLLQITDKDKLNLVQTYLAQEVRSWFFNREFTKWTEFKEALCERFAAKRSSKKATLRKLLDMKRLNHESISEYVDRFEDLRMAHIKDTKKDTKTTRLSDNDLLETFVNGLRPSFLKLVVKQNHPSTLNEAKRIVKEIEEDEEESLDESQEEELMSRAYEENGHDGYTSAITKMKLKNNEQPKNYAKMANKDNNTRREPVEQMDSNTESDNNFQRTMEKLANSVQNLTLLVESQNTARKPTQNTCYNCQEVGHSAKDCTQPCKLCHGQKGNHSYWNCELYSPTRNRRNGFQPKVTNESHLVITMSDNEGQMETNTITNESYAAQKRDATSSANEHERKSRSGKRVKAHDTIPENHPIRLKKQNNVGAVGYQNPTVMPSTEPAPKKTKPRKRKPGVEPIEVESVKPAEILQAPVH
ncbi:hypothetical protein G6F63_011230 [Rhizopus arrhizus]|nr:hypothetical protein G6F63_011230 [Rhizopus arrhizus]